jgi:pimeloyl-ACP methyl ester carboxylesterase
MKACINGNLIAYDDVGVGPAVILLHSFPLCRQMWEPQIKALSAEGFRVVAPDLRGFGESSSEEENFELTRLTDDINNLMSYLGIGRAVMVGISMAGGLLIDMLERYPQRVAATCFLSPMMQPGDIADEIRSLDLANLVREGHRATVTDNLCEKFLYGNPAQERKDLVGQLRNWIDASSPCALEGALSVRPQRLGYRDEHHPYPVPTLIMTGARDRVMFSNKQAGPVNELRQVINDAGHLVNLEAPDVVNQHLVGFLQNLNTIKLQHHRLPKVA